MAKDTQISQHSGKPSDQILMALTQMAMSRGAQVDSPTLKLYSKKLANERLDDLVSQEVQTPGAALGVTSLTREFGVSLQSLMVRIKDISEAFLSPEVSNLSRENKRKVLESLIKKLKLGNALKASAENLSGLSREDREKLAEAQRLNPPPAAVGTPTNVEYDARLYEAIKIDSLRKCIEKIYTEGADDGNAMLNILQVACGLNDAETNAVVAYLRRKTIHVPDALREKFQKGLRFLNTEDF